jgi:hypothetical protein
LTVNSSKNWFWPTLTWCLGIIGMVGVWLSIALTRDQACLWLGFLAALDIAFVMWLSGVHASIFRAIVNVLGVLIIIFLSQWMIAAMMFGSAWGIGHFEAATVVGKVLTWEFTRLRLTQIDYVFFGLSLLLAAVLGLLGKRREH